MSAHVLVSIFIAYLVLLPFVVRNDNDYDQY